jgi:hypothetical protein
MENMLGTSIFTSVILTTWETEIRKMAILGQPRQNICELTPKQKKKKKTLSVSVCTFISAMARSTK